MFIIENLKFIIYILFGLCLISLIFCFYLYSENKKLTEQCNRNTKTIDNNFENYRDAIIDAQSHIKKLYENYDYLSHEIKYFGQYTNAVDKAMNEYMGAGKWEEMKQEAMTQDYF